ncbi:MAG: hypothetical protein HOP18_21945 [Deltaproteobacteria bacterium]|nr:hypothetical protein [Deltaproteobacteria bacterium]
MPTEETGAIWSRKGATFSDKPARKEFGLTQEEIIQAIQEGKLQYRLNSIFGNPFFRLIRQEVEALVDEQYGNTYLKKKQLTNELAQINKELRRLHALIVGLEQRKAEVLESLGEGEIPSTSAGGQPARRHPAGYSRQAAKGQRKKGGT